MKTKLLAATLLVLACPVVDLEGQILTLNPVEYDFGQVEAGASSTTDGRWRICDFHFN